MISSKSTKIIVNGTIKDPKLLNSLQFPSAVITGLGDVRRKGKSCHVYQSGSLGDSLFQCSLEISPCGEIPVLCSCAMKL